jgi:hypothetical protein
MNQSVYLFELSKMKSKEEFQISEYNQFIYNFSESKSKKNKKSKKDTIKADEQLYYIKDSNMDIPSNDKLNDENFRKDFFYNYNDSFAKFCGLNKHMYIQMYKQIQYIPKLNQMGDVEINITNIIKKLIKYSSQKLVKSRKSLKIKNNIFENSKKIKPKISGKIKKDTDEIKNEENNLTAKGDINIEINDLKSNKTNIDKSKNNTLISINIEKERKFIIIKPHNKTLLNIKRNLKKISIKKQNEDIKINQTLNKEINNLLEHNKENTNIKSNDVINDLSVKTNLYLDIDKNKDQFSLINHRKYNMLISPENDLINRTNKNQDNIFNFKQDNDIDYFQNTLSFNNFSPDINLFNSNPVFSLNNLFFGK